MKRILARKTFLRYCLSYLLVLIAPITIAAASFNVRFLAEYRRTLIRQMQLTAEKTMADLERELSQMNMITLQFSYNEQFGANRLRTEPLLYRDIREQLENYVNISTYLSDIVYVNLQYPQRYYTSLGTYNPRYFNQYRRDGRSLDALAYLAGLNEKRWIALSEQDKTVSRRQTLEYACPLAGAEGGWALFLIPAAHIERILDLSPSQVHIRALFNDDGDRLWGDDSADALYHGALAASPVSGAGTGSRLVASAPGEYVLITTSPVLGLSCMYAIGERTLLEPMGRLSRQFLYLLLCLLLGGCALAIYLSHFMTRPIEALVSAASRVAGSSAPEKGGEIALVADALETVHRENVRLHSQYLRMERQNVLMRLMSGQYSRREELEEDCDGVQIPTLESVYATVLIDEMSMPTVEMEREIARIFGDEMLVFGFRFREQQCHVFLLVQEGKSRRSREVLFSGLTRRYPGIMLVLGSETEDLLLVRQSYQDAVFARRIALMKGQSAPVFSGEYPDGGDPVYPQQEIDALYTILCQKDVEKLRFIQDTLLYTLRALGDDPVFQQALCYDVISTYNRALAKLSIGGRSDRQPFRHYDRRSLHLDRLLEIIQGLYTEALDAFLAEETPVQSEEMDQIIAYIDAQREDLLNACEIAEHFGLSPSNLSHQFKRVTGETLSNYITGRKLALARELLCTTDLDVTEIGQRLGYNHPSSFIRMFRKMENVTPLQYREAHASDASSSF